MAENVMKVEKFSRFKCCILCKGKESDVAIYGPVYKLGKIEVHYFCLLLSSSVDQRGEDEEGILGFLPNDILRAVEKWSDVKCTFCSLGGASVRCAFRRCRVIFHYQCGIKIESSHRFSGKFPSYCPKHRIRQKIPKKVLDIIKNVQLNCGVCLENVKLDNSIIWAPCCQKYAFFHRICLQRMAFSFGSYALRCPLCNNKTKFCDALVENGIFIPEQDASWEVEPNAFSELLERHNRCDAVECVSPRGRNFSETPAWRIILCSDCGSQGTHRKCIKEYINSLNINWKCDVCRSTGRAPDEQLADDVYSSVSNSIPESDVDVVADDSIEPFQNVSADRPARSLRITDRYEYFNRINDDNESENDDNESENDKDQEDNSEQETSRNNYQLPVNGSVRRKRVKRSRSSRSDDENDESIHKEKVLVRNLDENQNTANQEPQRNAMIDASTSTMEAEPQGSRNLSPENSTISESNDVRPFELGPILIIDSDDEKNSLAICIDSDESDDDDVIVVPSRLEPDIDVTKVLGNSSGKQQSSTSNSRSYTNESDDDDVIEVPIKLESDIDVTVVMGNSCGEQRSITSNGRSYIDIVPEILGRIGTQVRYITSPANTSTSA